VKLYRGATALFAVAFLGIGIALLVITAVRGGGATGYILGVLFGSLVGLAAPVRPAALASSSWPTAEALASWRTSVLAANGPTRTR
jgi:hypothetical protein